MATPRTESSSGILERSNGLASNPVCEFTRDLTKVVRVEAWFLGFCTVLAILQVWLSRYAMNSDGESYLDIGDAYFRHDWAAAVNGYWSPLYSWLLGLALHTLRPSPHWEFITVHFVNLMVYVLALFCFRFFIHSVLRTMRKDRAAGDSGPLPDRDLLGLGYSIFLWASLVLIDPGTVTPDLLVAAIIFLIGGSLVNLQTRDSLGEFARFGALCGAAYLGKTIMFPLGLGLLAILLFSGRRASRRIWGVLLAGLMFAMVALPFVAALSKQKGRFAFGDSGRLAYASLVSPGTEQVHWRGEPAGSGTPRHTTRRLLGHPPVFEFADPVSGTYPPWYDPSYWNEGVQVNFRLRAQIRVLVQSALEYAKLLTGQLGLFAGLTILILAGGRPAQRAIASNWPLIAAAALSLALYSFVLVRSRYIGASVVLLLIAVLAGIRLPRNQQSEQLTKYVTTAVITTVLFAVMAHVAQRAYANLTGMPLQKEQLEAAEGLQRMGLRRGDRVAVIGDGMTDFWARLGRFKIVSEVYSPESGHRQFWAASWGRRNLAYECLGRSGAKVVVVRDPPASGDIDPGWKRIASTNYYVHSLPR
jgi:hypothetical protein